MEEEGLKKARGATATWWIRFLMSKKNKLRSCPVLGRGISSAECGAGRHQSIACTADCGHNPFAAANYDALLEVETKLDHCTLDAFAKEIGTDKVLRKLDQAARRGGDGGNAEMVRELFFRRDVQGRSFAERWLAAGTPEQSKDDRVFFAGKARMRPVLLELLEVRPDGLLRAVDLLEPEAGEILVLDRKGWARATRFQVLVIWAYPLPHFWRLCGSGVVWPEWRGCLLTPAEALAEVVAYAGGPTAGAPLAERRAWMAEHFEQLSDRLHAVTDARQRDMLEAVDASRSWCEFTLNAKKSAGIDAVFAHAEEVYQCDVQDEDQKAGFTVAYDFCLSPQEGDPQDRREILGRVQVRGATWRVEAMGQKKLQRLRERFLDLMGLKDLVPEREFTQDIGRQKADKISRAQEDLVPPRLRENPSLVDFKTYLLMRPKKGQAEQSPEEVARQTLQQAHASWIDAHVPALDGLTPREAVSSPTARVSLVRLLKEQIHAVDEARLRGKKLPDPMATVRELGLVELDTPAPPERPCPPELLKEMNAEEEGLPKAGPGLLPPSGTLTNEQVMDRLELVQAYFPKEEELLNAWVNACPGWFDEIVASCKDFLNDEAMGCLEIGLALAWAVMGGADRADQGRKLDAYKLRAVFDSAWASYDGLKTTAEQVHQMRALCPSQPALTVVILCRLRLDLERHDDVSKGELAKLFMAFAAWLNAAVPELERVLR